MKFILLLLAFGLIGTPLLSANSEGSYVNLIKEEQELQKRLQENLRKKKLKSETIFTWQTFSFASTLDKEHKETLAQIQKVKAKKREYETSAVSISKEAAAAAIDELAQAKPLNKDKKRFVFINGGANAAQNYISFDQTAVALNKHVFDNNLLVLSGRGNKSPIMVPNEEKSDVERHPSGEAKYFTWHQEENLPIQSATKGNFDAIIDQVSDEKAKDLTLIYYDHGSEDGVSFWYSDVDQKHLSSQYKKLNEDTTIRALHFHCHSEYSLVDINRVVPKENAAMAAFIKKNYPKNYCAMGASRADETAKNPSDTYNEDERNYFVKIAKYSAPFTLDTMRERVAIDWSATSTPILTSDLLLEDINKFVCQKTQDNRTEELFEGCELNQDEANPATSAEVSSYKNIFNQLCGNDLVTKINHHTDEIEQLEEESSKIKKDVLNFRKDYLKLTNPNLHNRVMGYYREQDRLLKLMALAEEPKKLEPLIRYSLIKAREDMGLERYHYTLLHDIDLDTNQDYRAYVKTKTSVSRLEQSKSRIKKLKESSLRQRKKLQDQLRQRRQELATQLFDLPIFQEAKETYEQVRKCETTPLN